MEKLHINCSNWLDHFEPNQLGSYEDSNNDLRKPIDNNNSKDHNNRSNVVGSDSDDNALGSVLRPSTLNLDDLSSGHDIPRKGELIKEGQDSRNNPKEPRDSKEPKDNNTNSHHSALVDGSALKTLALMNKELNSYHDYQGNDDLIIEEQIQTPNQQKKPAAAKDQKQLDKQLSLTSFTDQATLAGPPKRDLSLWDDVEGRFGISTHGPSCHDLRILLEVIGGGLKPESKVAQSTASTVAVT